MRRKRKKSKPRRCLYVVELSATEVYVGSTNQTPQERLAQHKRGGRTSNRSVRTRGKRLRPDLSRGSATECELRKRLKRRGYKVHGSCREFKPTRS